MPHQKGIKPVAQNRKAFHDYFVEERYECGVALYGTEVKSIRAGTLNLNGGYIAGNGGTSVNYARGIHVTGGTVNVRGAVIAGNTCTSTSGGAGVYMQNGTFNMYSGVISGNTSYYNGAGVLLDSATGSMSGGYITNNYQTRYDDYNDGGGGVCLTGDAAFSLWDGYITGNLAVSGAGIHTVYGEPTTVNMSGGFISGNYATEGEGGGIRIEAEGVGNITGGYITNNVSNTHEHWGGGVLFNAYDSTVYLTSALITDNDAGGFGGGVAGCSTGRIYLSAIDNETLGSAIYNNTATGTNLSGSSSSKGEDHTFAASSPVFMQSGYQDYFCALYSHVIDGMLGGGSQNWHGSVDGVAMTIPRDGEVYGNSMVGLTADPNRADERAAEAAATVYITGNYSVLAYYFGVISMRLMDW